MRRLGRLLLAEELEAARARWYVAWHLFRFGAGPEIAKLKARGQRWRLEFWRAAAVALAREWGEWDGYPEGPGLRPLAELAARERELRP